LVLSTKHLQAVSTIWGCHAKIRYQLASPSESTRLLAKLLREARDTDVWQFVSLAEVWRRWPAVAPQLGQRRGFWQFLLSQWQREGLLG